MGHAACRCSCSGRAAGARRPAGGCTAGAVSRRTGRWGPMAPAEEEDATRGLSQGSGRRRAVRCLSNLHLTVVVAVVRTFRRTSAHKGSPLFHRREPASSTADPEGSPGISGRDAGKPFRLDAEILIRSSRNAIRDEGAFACHDGVSRQGGACHSQKARDILGKTSRGCEAGACRPLEAQPCRTCRVSG